MKIPSSIAQIIVFLALISCSQGQDQPEATRYDVSIFPAQEVQKSDSTTILMRYNAWYGTRKRDDHWYEWVNSNLLPINPDMTDVNGVRRGVHSNLRPLIDLYSSSNPDVLRYHLLLMKYAGVDVVQLFWEGPQSYRGRSYPNASYIHLNNLTAVSLLKEVGLQYSYFYVDDSFRMIDPVTIEPNPLFRATLDSFYSQLASEPHYFYTDLGVPVLFMGMNLPYLYWPKFFVDSPIPFQFIFSLNQVSFFPIEFIPQRYQGVFIEPLHYTPDQPDQYINLVLEAFYGTAFRDRIVWDEGYEKFAVASMGNNPSDFFEGSQSRDGLGGALPFDYQPEHLRSMLNIQRNMGASQILIHQWNNFRKGQVVEPTVEYEYEVLEILAEFNQSPYGVEDFKRIHRWYELQSAATLAAEQNPEWQYKSDMALQAYYYLVSLQIDEADALMDVIEEILE